jgi:hypothetical protein
MPVHDLVQLVNAQARVQGWPVRCDPDLDFENPELAWFISVWDDVRGDRTMPVRADLTARVLKQNLAKLMLFERIQGEERHFYRVRLMATGLTQIWGDITGKLIDEALPERLLPRWYGFLDLIILHRGPLRFVSRVDYQGKDFLVAEIGGAPIADETGNPTMVMAAIDTSGERSWEAVMDKYDGVKPLKQRRALAAVK